MQKTIMYCDRCKKEFEKWNHKKTELYRITECTDGEYLLSKDLCKSCYTEFENWWNLYQNVESDEIQGNSKERKNGKDKRNRGIFKN